MVTPSFPMNFHGFKLRVATFAKWIPVEGNGQHLDADTHDV
jgi:hypothetical protein